MKVKQCEKSQELCVYPQTQLPKPSNTGLKLALVRSVPGKEDQELALLQRISFLEWPASELADLQHIRLEATYMLLRVQTYFSIHCLEETASQAFMLELRQRNHYFGRTTSRKALLEPTNTRNGHLMCCHLCCCPMSPNLTFGSAHCVFVRCRECEQTSWMCGSHCEASVMVWGDCVGT